MRVEENHTAFSTACCAHTPPPGVPPARSRPVAAALASSHRPLALRAGGGGRAAGWRPKRGDDYDKDRYNVSKLMWQLASPKGDCDDATCDRSADIFDNPDHVAIVIHHEMLAHKSGGSIVSLTASLAKHPIAGVHASIPMMTKGGMDAMTRSLAIA
jgi:hypothetical protein